MMRSDSLTLAEMNDSTEEIEDIYQEFILTRNDFKDDLVYSFFEGKDDYSYYGIRIKQYTNKAVQPYDCNGKDNVLILYLMIKNNTKALAENDLLFFIDRDFEVNIVQSEDIYVTPCYAIENFYITDNALDEFLKGELQINKYSIGNKKQDYESVIDYYRQERRNFIEEISLLNSWYSLQKNKSYKFKKEDKPDLSRLKSAYSKSLKGEITIEKLKELTPRYIDINEVELEAEQERLLTNPLSNFRGKYYEEFLHKILSQIISEANSPNKLFTEKRKVSLNIGKTNMISILSQYAETPECLNEYIKNRIERVSNF